MNVVRRAPMAETETRIPVSRILPFNSPLRAVPGIDRVARSRQFSELIDHTRMLALSESALEKLAHLIARWGRDFGERTADGIRVRIWLTQEEIAQIIGASRETVTRLFSALKRDGIVHVKRDLMWIRDSDALASLARMSPEMCD